MKKRILAFMLSVALLATLQVFASAEEEKAVAAAGGTVTINYNIGKNQLPVTVLILPEITETGANVTEAKLAAVTELSGLKSLPVTYLKTVKTNEEGMLIHTCKVRADLPTGAAHVYISYLGSEKWIKLGEFEHVKSGDIDNLLGWFNDGTVSYQDAIKWDEEGKDESAAVKILRKSAADVDRYLALGKNQADFCEILESKKPESGFEITSLVDLFNESLAWMELYLEEETLNIIEKYNAKYWSLPIAETDDFSGLSEDEQTRILSEVKEGKYSDKEKLSADFTEELALSMFRLAETREDLEEVIAESGKYESYYKEIRELLDEADLSTYDKTKVLNEVLGGNSSCESLEGAKELFENAIEEIEDDSSSGGSSGGSGGGGYKNSGAVSVSKSSGGGSLPSGNAESAPSQPKSGFSDVNDDNWAADYVKRLSDKKVISGVGDGKFAPELSVKRQDFVKILIGALEIEEAEAENEFSDVADDSYYASFVMTAVSNGLISGTGDGAFGVDLNMSREDAAVIMSRALKMYGKEVTGQPVEFTDGENISDYAKEAVALVSGAGIFAGDDEGRFNPKEELSRAQACAILCRLADMVKGGIA